MKLEVPEEFVSVQQIERDGPLDALPDSWATWSAGAWSGSSAATDLLRFDVDRCLALGNEGRSPSL